MKLNLFRSFGFVACIALFSINSSCLNASSETSTSETSSKSEADREEVALAEYACPMKCEKEKI